MGLEEDDRRAALSGLGETLASDDAEAALGFLAETADPDAMVPFARSAFWQCGIGRNSEPFLDRALELPEGRLRNAALGWVVCSMVGQIGILRQRHLLF